jgi:hypothetical protein
MWSIANFIAAALLCFPLQQCLAHSLEQSYVYLTVSDDALSGRIELNIPDLNSALGTDLATDGSLTDADIAPHIEDIRNYLISRVGFAPNGAAEKTLPLTDYELTSIPLTQYLIYHFEFPQFDSKLQYVDVDYAVLFDEVPNHRGMLMIETNWGTGTFENEAQVSLDFNGNNTSQRLDLSDSSVWRGFGVLVRQGIHHIWIGIDHILFLIALLLPSVVRREAGTWTPVTEFRPAFIYVIKVVTIFTIAHTMTLSLASLNLFTLPSRLVESVIALSIAIAAAEVLYPIFRGRIWIIVFAFGLFHGFGFATVLGELGIPPKYVVHSLLGFNIGVEIGQVAIVCAVFPLLYLFRKWWVYRRLVLTYGSILLIAVSLYWFIERGFGIDLPAGSILNAIIDTVKGLVQ